VIRKTEIRKTPMVINNIFAIYNKIHKKQTEQFTIRVFLQTLMQRGTNNISMKKCH
jgi:hypothetical protein